MSEASSPPRVRTEQRGPVRVLTIDHPPVNVLAAPVLEALVAELDTAEHDADTHVVVLASASEKVFAAGADIRAMAPMGPEEARVAGGRGQAVTKRIEALPLPVIAAVEGTCLGGGCEVALACDLVVAGERATFGQPEIRLGVMPGWGGTQRLPLRIGPGAARRWIYTGRNVDAAEARAEGVVDILVPSGRALAEAVALAEEIAVFSPLAVAAAKYAIHNAVGPMLEQGLRTELDLWARLFGSEGQRGGMAAFLEKRPPPKGRRTSWESESAGFPWARPSGTDRSKEKAR